MNTTMRQVTSVFIILIVSTFNIAVAQCDSNTSNNTKLKNLIEGAGGIMGISYQLEFRNQSTLAILTVSKKGKILKSHSVNLGNATLGKDIIIYHNPLSEPDEFTLKFKKSVTREITKNGEKSAEFLLAGNKIDDRVSDYLKFGETLEIAFQKVLCAR